jgi:hypothetical protein
MIFTVNAGHRSGRSAGSAAWGWWPLPDTRTRPGLKLVRRHPRQHRRRVACPASVMDQPPRFRAGRRHLVNRDWTTAAWQPASRIRPDCATTDKPSSRGRTVCWAGFSCRRTANRSLQRRPVPERPMPPARRLRRRADAPEPIPGKSGAGTPPHRPAVSSTSCRRCSWGRHDGPAARGKAPAPNRPDCTTVQDEFARPAPHGTWFSTSGRTNLGPSCGDQGATCVAMLVYFSGSYGAVRED